MPELDPNVWPDRAHNAAEVLRARQVELLASREYNYGRTRRSHQRPETVAGRVKAKFFPGRT